MRWLKSWKAAPSETCADRTLECGWSDDREVTLDGAVRGAEDFTFGGVACRPVPAWLTCVIDLSWCRRRRQIRSQQRVTFSMRATIPRRSDCFRKASADPNNRAAKDLLDQRWSAADEEELLKTAGKCLAGLVPPQRLAFHNSWPFNIRETERTTFELHFKRSVYRRPHPCRPRL